MCPQEAIVDPETWMACLRAAFYISLFFFFSYAHPDKYKNSIIQVKKKERKLGRPCCHIPRTYKRRYEHFVKAKMMYIWYIRTRAKGKTPLATLTARYIGTCCTPIRA